MPRRYASIARIIWFPRLYLDRPLLARTRIQRCQPSVVSSARAACSMRSRSALRRASRSSSVSGPRLKRRSIGASFRLGARPAGGPIPRHPHARQGVPPSGGGVGPPAGGDGLRPGVELFVELVEDAVVRLQLGRLARGALLLA